MTGTDRPAPTPIDNNEREASLEGFGTDRPEPRPETIAPGSALYLMLCDASVAAYSLPMFLSPLLHPATAHATDRYDPAFQGEQTDPVKMVRRLWNTMEMISGVVYARDESDQAADSVRELHRAIKGELANGESYHAWSRDIWSWNWAAITAGIMDVYGGIRGFPSEQFRDEAYLGLVEVGRRFNVLGMPATYPDFVDFWPAERDRVADPHTPAIRRVASAIERGGLARPASAPYLPAWLWDLTTAPVRHLQRVAVLAAIPERYHADMGLTPSAHDAKLLRRHRQFWRLVPRRLSHGIGVRVLWRHHESGTPGWRGHFSPSELAFRREAVKKAAAPTDHSPTDQRNP